MAEPNGAQLIGQGPEPVAPDLAAAVSDGAADHVVGVRSGGSGRICYVSVGAEAFAVGEWVAVETAAGYEVGHIVVAPGQVARNSLGDLPAHGLRRAPAEDIERIDALARGSTEAVRTGERQARDETRLVGSGGHRHTPDGASRQRAVPGMAEDAAIPRHPPLEPDALASLRDRVRCCPSTENVHYKLNKARRPRLGEPVQSPDGPGLVVAIQPSRDRMTVRLDGDGSERAFTSTEIGASGTKPTEQDVPPAKLAGATGAATPAEVAKAHDVA